MVATYRHSVRLADAKPLRDGLAAVFHDGSGDPSTMVEIRRVILRLPGVSTQTTVPFNLDLHLISASTGGIAASYSKMDTNAGDLPAQVVASCMPDAVTLGALIRGLADTHAMNATSSTFASRARGNWRTAASSDSAHILSKTGGVSDTEPVILREGEGLALVCRTGTGGTARAMRARMLVRVVSTGRCYFFRFNDVATPPMTGGVFSLMNNTGSGIVIEVRAIEFPPEGDSAVIPRVQLAMIDGIETVWPGTSATSTAGNGFDLAPTQDPIAFDTQNVLPPTIKCYTAGFIARKRGVWAMADWWYNQGSIATLANQQNRGVNIRHRVLQLPGRGSTTGGFTSGLTNEGIDGVEIWKAPARGDGIVLRPGDGFAVLGGAYGNLDNSAYSSYDIHIDFTVRSDARGRRAGMGYVS